MDKRVPPPRVDGLSWNLHFGGADGRPDWAWSHFDLVHAQARLTIADHPDLPIFARRLLTGTDETPRIETDGNVVAGVLPAYARTGDAEQFELTCWHFAMLPHCLITGRRRSTRALVTMWEAIEAGLAPAGPANLVDRCLAEFAREVRARLVTLAADLDPIEDMLIEQREAGQLNDLGGRLGAVRRDSSTRWCRSPGRSTRTRRMCRHGPASHSTMQGIGCCTAPWTTSRRSMTGRARYRTN